MRPIRTADDIAAVARDELWNAPASDLTHDLMKLFTEGPAQ